jgi:hypothetical protein
MKQHEMMEAGFLHTEKVLLLLLLLLPHLLLAQSPEAPAKRNGWKLTQYSTPPLLAELPLPSCAQLSF